MRDRNDPGGFNQRPQPRPESATTLHGSGFGSGLASTYFNTIKMRAGERYLRAYVGAMQALEEATLAEAKVQKARFEAKRMESYVADGDLIIEIDRMQRQIDFLSKQVDLLNKQADLDIAKFEAEQRVAAAKAKGRGTTVDKDDARGIRFRKSSQQERETRDAYDAAIGPSKLRAETQAMVDKILDGTPEEKASPHLRARIKEMRDITERVIRDTYS